MPGATPTDRSTMKTFPIRGSAAVLFLAGLTLAAIAVACISATVRVHDPVAKGLMCGWFASLLFVAAWFTQTQERATD
jgi:hypothetical protein